LTSEAVKAIDDDLKVMIAGTTKLIGEIKPEGRSWDGIQSCMVQNPLAEPVDDGIAKTDNYTKSGANFFKFDGGPDGASVKKVSFCSLRILLVKADSEH
jgi:hypothetical protein